MIFSLSAVYANDANNISIDESSTILTSQGADEDLSICQDMGNLDVIREDLSEQNENYTSFYEFSTESYGELEYISTEYFHKILVKRSCYYDR